MDVLYRSETKRFQFTFKDVNDAVYDPTTQAITIYDPTGELINTYDEGDVTYVSAGVYYIDYDIPSDAEYGRWQCRWSGTRASITATGVELVQVMPTNAPTIQEIRYALGGMSDDRVIDEAVVIAIMDGMQAVDNEKSASAEQRDIARAYVSCSAYHTYLAYVSEFERTAGMVPGPIMNHLRDLERKCKDQIKFVQRGGGPAKKGPTIATGKTEVPEDWDDSNSEYRE